MRLINVVLRGLLLGVLFVAASARPGHADSTIDRVMRHYARSVTDTVLFAMRVNDKSALLPQTSGKLLATYRRKLKNQTLKTMLDKIGDRPRYHYFRCTHCDRYKGTCQVLVDIQREDDKAGKLTPVLFYIENNRRDPELKMTDIRLARGDRLKTFRAQNPVCGKN